MQLSELIGKPVLTPAGESYGYVIGLRLEQGYGKLAALVVADEEEEEFYLPLRFVHSCGDAVIARGGRSQTPVGLPSPIGREVFSSAGVRLGYVSDLILGGEGGFLVLSPKKYATVPVDLASFGEKIILYPDRAAKESARRTSNRTKQKRAPAPVRKSSQTPAEETNEAQTERRPPQNGASEPLTGVDLLGKRVRRDVRDRSGVPVAHAGDRVTCAMLSAARRKNCLLRLYLSTLTG